MNAIVMILLLIVAVSAFAFSARHRWRLMTVGSPGSPGPRIDRIGQRLLRTLRYAIGQRRLARYRLAGVAHMAVFFGFLVLVLRSLILFARGFVDDPTFGYWILDSGSSTGNVYSLIKDLFIVAVVLGVLVFLYYRLVVKLPRMTLSAEAILILGIILVMMVADVVYDGASIVRMAGTDTSIEPAFNGWEPLGSVLALIMQPLSEGSIVFLQHAGFWIHVALVLIFFNILPYSKHFHVITAIPNVFCQDLEPAGRLKPIEDVEGRVEREETLGIRRIDQFSWKSILDLYTCTECGRCTDQCPASLTGKALSPKKLTFDLRNYLYRNGATLIAGSRSNDADAKQVQDDLVPAVIEPEVLWACTSCRACEQECPVLISYVDKIVDMRRYLVQEMGEFPEPLQEAFRSLEAVGSPYGAAADERMKWAEGLEVPLRSDVDEIDVLFWVGCAPATDERAKEITRAVAQLLNEADIDWAVLGHEESCTGDVARRAGNEFLFQMMAQTNIEILDGYNTKTIITVCPHCYNTLKHEYPDFGGRYEVIHHTEFLAKLVADGRLVPAHPVNAKIAYHDSCYLGRYNDIYDPPRRLLESISGIELIEPEATRDRGMCCGAGGGHMFKEEEQGEQHVNDVRASQLAKTGADMVATACPFCIRMLTDAMNSHPTADVSLADPAELLLQSIRGTSSPTGDNEALVSGGRQI